MDPNKGNPYMQGANPFMQDKSEPPINGSPNAQTPVSGGVMDAGMAPVGGGNSSETTKPRQMPAGSPPPGMGAGPGRGVQPPLPMPPLGRTTDPGATPQGEAIGRAPARSGPAQGEAIGTAPAGGSRQVDNMSATSLLRQVRAEIKRDNPEVPVVEAHRLAMAVVDLIQAEAAQPINHTGPRNGYGGQWGDMNNPSNPYSPLHPRNRQHLQRMLNPTNGGDQEQSSDGQWHPQAGGYTKFDDRAYQSGYRGNYPYATGAGLLLIDKMRNRHSGQTPPGKDHPDSRQIPASS